MAKLIKHPVPAEPKKDAYYVYIGPSVKGVINYGSIIHTEPEAAEPAITSYIVSYPTAALFFIPGDRLAEANIKIKTRGTALYAAYHKLVRQLTRN